MRENLNDVNAANMLRLRLVMGSVVGSLGSGGGGGGGGGGYTSSTRQYSDTATCCGTCGV